MAELYWLQDRLNLKLTM